MNQALKITCGVILVLALSACTAGSAASQHAAADGPISQFVLGLWHGVIAPVTLIVEIINRFAPHLLPWRLHLYESKNTSVPYDVGFYLGLVGSPIVVRGGWSRRR